MLEAALVSVKPALWLVELLDFLATVSLATVAKSPPARESVATVAKSQCTIHFSP